MKRKLNLLISILWALLAVGCADTRHLYSDWRKAESIPVYDKGMQVTPKYMTIKKVEYLICTGGSGRLAEGGTIKQAKWVLADMTGQIGGNVVVNFQCKGSIKDIRINCTEPLLCSAQAAKFE